MVAEIRLAALLAQATLLVDYKGKSIKLRGKKDMTLRRRWPGGVVLRWIPQSGAVSRMSASPTSSSSSEPWLAELNLSLGTYQVQSKFFHVNRANFNLSNGLTSKGHNRIG